MACSRSGVRTSPAPPFYAAVRQSRLTAVFLCSRRRGDGNAVHSSVAHSSAECVSAAQSWVGSTTGRRVNDGAGREVGTKVGVGRGVEGAAVVADGGGIAAHGSGGKHRPHGSSIAKRCAQRGGECPGARPALGGRLCQSAGDHSVHGRRQACHQHRGRGWRLAQMGEQDGLRATLEWAASNKGAKHRNAKRIHIRTSRRWPGRWLRLRLVAGALRVAAARPATGQAVI